MLFLVIFCLWACTSGSNVNSQFEETKHSSPAPSPPDQDSLNYVMGQFEPQEDERFVVVEQQYADREGLLMRREAYEAFKEMWKAARKDGVELVVRSATRNFDYQKGIWERKWNGETILSNGINAAQDIAVETERALEILKYSSMPGTSRHHWGTDIDLNSFNNSWFESGKGLEVFNWLTLNASRFGYCRPYTTKDTSRPDGYNEEKWHWSYIPLANDYTRFAKNNLKNNMITGFKGSKVATEIAVVDKYVLGINPECKP